MKKLAAVLAVVTCSTPVFAQDASPTTDETAQTTTETSASGSDGVQEELRFRGGFSIGGGLVLGGGGTAPAGMAQGRFGVQINRMFAVFYQPTATASVLLGAASAAASVFEMNTIAANLTLGDIFEVGVGPSIDYAVMAVAAPPAGIVTVTGITFGVDARVAFIPGGGSRAPNGRRSGFSIVANVHPIFTSAGAVVPLTLGIGADWF